MPNGDILAQHESAGPELSPINPAENGTLVRLGRHAIKVSGWILEVGAKVATNGQAIRVSDRFMSVA
jgi:hypothetical protein